MRSLSATATMNAWIRLVRPINGVMGFTATYISALVGIGFSIITHLFPVTVAAICVFLVMSGGNVINDLMDIDIDKTNHPDRPIVSGKISVHSATYFSVIVFLLPVLLSAVFLSYISSAIVVVAIAALISYEMRLKRLGISGNLAISVLVGLIFVFGGISVQVLTRMIPLFFMAFLTNTARELIKDIEDMAGDVDRVTFPKKYGVSRTGVLASVFTIAGILISYVPFYLGYFGLVYLIIVFVADAIFIVSILHIRRDPGKSQNFSKLGMIMGLIAFTVGGVL